MTTKTNPRIAFNTIVAKLFIWDGIEAPKMEERVEFYIEGSKQDALDLAQAWAERKVGANGVWSRRAPDEDCPHFAKSYELRDLSRCAMIQSLAGEQWDQWDQAQEPSEEN